MSEPHRVQLSRRKGWTMPANTVKVSRPSMWGNPFKPSDTLDAVRSFRALVETRYADYPDWWERLRRLYGTFRQRPIDIIKHDLRGKNLACWCPLVDEDGKPVPCHADVLLELANAPQESSAA